MSHKTGIEHSSRERWVECVYTSRVNRHTPGTENVGASKSSFDAQHGGVFCDGNQFLVVLVWFHHLKADCTLQISYPSPTRGMKGGFRSDCVTVEERNKEQERGVLIVSKILQVSELQSSDPSGSLAKAVHHRE